MSACTSEREKREFVCASASERETERQSEMRGEQMVK